jgi:hypothetical protein
MEHDLLNQASRLIGSRTVGVFWSYLPYPVAGISVPDMISQYKRRRYDENAEPCDFIVRSY